MPNRYHIFLAIIVCYAAPLIALIFFSALQFPLASMWLPTTSGLLLTGLGGLILFMLMSGWERSLDVVDEPQAIVPDPLPQVSTVDPQLLIEAEARYCSTLEELTASTIKSDNLEALLVQANSEILNLTKEKEKIQRQVEQTRHEYDLFKASMEEKLEQNHLFLGEYQQTINEQRQMVETKQQLTEQLETKVRDLTYEIKTLLQLAEKVQYDKPQTVVPISLGAHVLNESPVSYHSGEGERHPIKKAEPSLAMGKAGQLRRCLDIAQKITGGTHYANRQPKTRDISFDNNALDLRRLCESLRSEATSALWVYSQKENKLLFTNQEIKNHLGWHPEKFMQNFFDIVDAVEWQRVQSQLAYKNECEASLFFQAKSGQSIELQCHLGIIPTGLFRGHIICIAQPHY